MGTGKKTHLSFPLLLIVIHQNDEKLYLDCHIYILECPLHIPHDMPPLKKWVISNDTIQVRPSQVNLEPLRFV